MRIGVWSLSRRTLAREAAIINSISDDQFHNLNYSYSQYRIIIIILLSFKCYIISIAGKIYAIVQLNQTDKIHTLYKLKVLLINFI